LTGDSSGNSQAGDCHIRQDGTCHYAAHHRQPKDARFRPKGAQEMWSEENAIESEAHDIQQRSYRAVQTNMEDEASEVDHGRNKRNL